MLVDDNKVNPLDYVDVKGYQYFSAKIKLTDQTNYQTSFNFFFLNAAPKVSK